MKVTTSPVSSALRASTTLSDSLSTTSDAAVERLVAELRVHRDAHLAAAGEHVDGAVVVVAEQRAVGRRRLGELVDLLAQRRDVVARLPQGVGELLVLRHRLAQLALGLEQPLLQGAHALGRVLEPAPQREDLLLEGAGVLLQLGQLVLLADGDHLLDRCLVAATLHRHIPPVVAGFIRRWGRVSAPIDPPRGTTTMKVWIDQDLCTGDGLCEEIAPTVFTLLDDGLAYVKDGDKVLSDPGGAEGIAPVPAGQEEATIESAEECPGECIFIEVE